MKRAILLVLDSFGIGNAPDASTFGDAGADTLGHIAQFRANADRPLELPNLARLGLYHAHHLATGDWAAGVTLPDEVDGAWACAREISSGKDTPSGHWEIAGVPALFEWGYFLDAKNSFPPELLEALIERAELPGLLGNCQASGMPILEALGEEHIRSGKPIVYTSADSVFQIAAHETHYGLDRLYALCEIARELLMPYNIGRVIARPFVGETTDTFERTGNRRDYAIEPPTPTVLQKLHDSGGKVFGVGKIGDIYAHCGISEVRKAHGHDALFDATLKAIDDAAAASRDALVMTNFVDFDTLYGHRRDPEGYAAALEAFDRRLPEIQARLAPGDLLILTADHGNDPTWRGTDHTREQVPVLVAGGVIAPGNYGRRDTYADIGQTLAEHFGLSAMDHGRSLFESARQGET
ncbi:phosphopentomutase [Salinicola rhizosphaerae]|uniref:Phosphopentomutase n=1 Tax=Salinicola rhizosphaerae TaxID=1443141 RepID=A0ABQ3DTH7_9GAMM|nr:phosphopentomutase [Salinicola rhizosphaerae]GHB15800.1 phosphopentomutase [Salinicola rhizosphaerae]